MNRKLIYTFGLIGFFLVWGIFGFMKAAPHSEPVVQTTILAEDNPQVVPGATANAAIPVTGERPSVAEILLVYALFAIGALALILALLYAANKQTVLYAHRKKSLDKS